VRSKKGAAENIGHLQTRRRKTRREGWGGLRNSPSVTTSTQEPSGTPEEGENGRPQERPGRFTIQVYRSAVMRAGGPDKKKGQ